MNEGPQHGRKTRENPELVSVFMTTTAANVATVTEREAAEAEQVNHQR
ncbi:hypothetical protein H5V11_11835 [Escherichia coli]|nr:hypothetical protein [Escherichia coli]